jgi:hypothetical protein
MGRTRIHFHLRLPLTLLGGAVAAWPPAARAQQSAQVRRIAVLMPFAEDHPVGQARVVAFVQRLRQLGWTDGYNVRIDFRWSAGDSDNIRKFASEKAKVSCSRNRPVTGGDGSLDYPLTRARVTPIIYFGVTTCSQGDVGQTVLIAVGAATGVPVLLHPGT